MNTIDILKEIITIPSFVDGDQNEAQLLAYITDFLKKNTSLNITTQPVEGNRYNIIASGSSTPKIVLFAHTDTVLPKKETDSPFEPKIDGNKLFGLGSVDMKSGLAVMLNIAQTYKNPDIAYVFSVDEEYEFKGSLKLKEFPDFHPEFIINVEPTDNKILSGCRGITEFSFKVHGKSVHAGRKPFGINAIEKSVELITKFQTELTTLDTEEGGKTTINLAYLHGGTLKQTPNNQPEISGLGMVVPNYAEVNCEIRIANKQITTDYIETNLTSIATQIGVSISDISFKFYLGSMLTPKANLSTFEQAIINAGIPLEYADVSLAGFYEVQLLQENWGGNSVVFGASPINMSHTANEYVEIDSVEKTEKVIVEYLKLIGVHD